MNYGGRVNYDDYDARYLLQYSPVSLRLLDARISSALLERLNLVVCSTYVFQMDCHLDEDFVTTNKVPQSVYIQKCEIPRAQITKKPIWHSFLGYRYHMTLCNSSLIQPPILPIKLHYSEMLNPSTLTVPNIALYPNVTSHKTTTPRKVPHNSFILYCQQNELSPKKASPKWKMVPQLEKEIYKKRVALMKIERLRENEEIKVENVNHFDEAIAALRENVNTPKKSPKKGEAASKKSEKNSAKKDLSKKFALVENIVPKKTKSPKKTPESPKKTNGLILFRKESDLEYAEAMKAWKNLEDQQKLIYKVRASEINAKNC